MMNRAGKVQQLSQQLADLLQPSTDQMIDRLAELKQQAKILEREEQQLTKQLKLFMAGSLIDRIETPAGNRATYFVNQRVTADREVAEEILDRPTFDRIFVAKDVCNLRIS